MNKFRRITFFHVNKSQRLFLYPIIISFFLGCMVSWLSLVYFLIDEYLFGPELDRLQKAIPGLLALASVLMIAVVFWTLRLSNRYFGAYERIIRDFDNILSGKKCGPLVTRKGDQIFEGLLRRINTLINNK